MIDIMALSPQQLERFLHMQATIDRQENDAARVRALREYYGGEHPILLTERQKEYLGALLDSEQFTFAHNVVRSVIDTLRERLDVSGLNVNGATADDAEGETSEPPAQLAALFWQWWGASKSDAAQITLYRRALRDGKAYVIVDWDTEHNRPKFIVHRLDAGDVQPGIILHRDPEDATRTLYASRYFYMFDPLSPGVTGTQRKTVYLPGEIRKYVRDRSGQWAPYQEIGDPSWPLPWVNAMGEPLGIPVIEFSNPGGSEVSQIIGLQNALNKSWLDLIAAADANGFPLLAIEYQGESFGTATDDANLEGADEFRISPGRAIEVDNATVKRLDASNLGPMIDTIWTVVQAVSGVSRTPAYYLRPVGGGDVPSGEALKQLESGLVKRAQERQLIFGQAWADAFEIAYHLAHTFGASVTVPKIDELSIQAVWTDANVRNELAQAQVGQVYQALGVPQDTIWQYVLGFTPSEVAGWKADQRREDAIKIVNIAESLRRSGLQAQRPTDMGGNDGRTNNTVPEE